MTNQKLIAFIDGEGGNVFNMIGLTIKNLAGSVFSIVSIWAESSDDLCEEMEQHRPDAVIMGHKMNPDGPTMAQWIRDVAGAAFPIVVYSLVGDAPETAKIFKDSVSIPSDQIFTKKNVVDDIPKILAKLRELLGM